MKECFKRFLVMAVFLNVCFSSLTAMAETFSTSEYYPLESGMAWTYLQDGINSVTNSVLSGDIYINGIATKAVLQSGGEFSGEMSYYSNNENGISEHKEYAPNVFVEGVGFQDITVILNPALKIVNATVTVDEIINSSGTVNYTFSGLGTFLLNYESTSKFVQLENITVPSGSFIAAKTQMSLTISGYINSQYVTSTSTHTMWLAKYIGIVKQIDTIDGLQSTKELVTINFQPYLSADFTVNQPTGFTEQPLNFTDNSDGNISSWLWDFGDGSTSTSQNPIYAYTTPGDYTVCLAVAGLGNSDTECKTNYINITIPVLKGDLNSDGIVDLVDAIMALKVAISWAPTGPVELEADINNDGLIGIEEAIYALQVSAEIRQ